MRRARSSWCTKDTHREETTRTSLQSVALLVVVVRASLAFLSPVMATWGITGQEIKTVELKNLQKHIWVLATLPETDAPVVSCYLSLEQGRIKSSHAFEERIRSLRGSFTGQARRDVEEALAPIDAYLAAQLLPDARGTAIFSRAGYDPFFLPLQFHVPLPNWVAVDHVPNLYHLVELKDTYHRYVVLISTQESARIVEVNLGAVTERVWKEKPELRKRVGREWTKEHYQKHRNDRSRTFIKEQVKLLEQLMSAGGHTHLILAGHPTLTRQVRDALPQHVVAKLVDMVAAPGKGAPASVVPATIASFVEAEEKESQLVAETLSHQIHTGGLAVAGTGASFRALKRGQVDVLVLAQHYSPGQVWVHAACDFIAPDREKPPACPDCGAAEWTDCDIKEEMVRLAAQQERAVEIVNESAALQQLGGVGCLLRFRLPDTYAAEHTSARVR